MTDTAVKPPKALLRPAGQAVVKYGMIREGDSILLAVSGGKDSLSLLHVLLHLQRHAPVRFELAAMTVDPQIEGFDPAPLKDYMASRGVPYHYVSQPIAERARHEMDGDSFCSFCSRMKRGAMYATCRAHGYNVLALAQHLDDLAESFLMSAFRGGQLRTMKACYTNDAGDIRVIRPFVYVRERQLAAFAQEAALPVIMDNCPACFSKPTERQHIKTLLAGEERHNRDLFKSLLTAITPLMTEPNS